MADGGLTLALAIGGLVTSVGATAYSVVSQMSAADNQADAQRSMAAQAESNATAAKQQAEANAARIRKSNRRAAASIRVNTAANGLLATGSADAVAYDSALQGELNAVSEIYAGSIAANSSSFEADMYRRRASVTESQKTGIAIGGALSGVGSIISTAGTYRRDKKLIG